MLNLSWGAPLGVDRTIRHPYDMNKCKLFMNEINIEVFDSFLPKAEFNKLSDSQKVDYYFNFSDWFGIYQQSCPPVMPCEATS